MKNWAQNLEFTPLKVFSPQSVEEIKTAITSSKKEGRTLRMRGSAHSWTGLIETNQHYLHLDELQGIIDAWPEQKKIKAWAGTKLSLFGEEAFKHKLAMENQGDINKQSIAGATSTGTHGTGINLQSVANQISSLTIINGKGEEVIVDETSPHFNAARLSLGSFGIVSEMTFKLTDAYKLEVKTFPEDFEESLNKFDYRIRNNRHLEMFYFPVGKWSLTKLMNKTEGPVTDKGTLHKLNEIIVENWLYTQLNRIASTTGKYKLIDKLIRTFVSPETKVDWSHRAFPTERSFKFMEMEYNLPVEKFIPVMKEMTLAIEKNGFQTLFPIEIRFVKKDDLWISPAFERDSVYFAIHTYITEDYRPYFDCMEEILQRHEGRPHWGKWHTMDSKKLNQVYPKWSDFLESRKSFDPDGMFLNDHLKYIFGL